MIRSTQPLLFKAMPILHKFRIHHPLPLNPRESALLLNLLTTSFRQQLNNNPSRPDASFSPPKTPTTFSNHGKGRRRSYSDSSIRPTDLHMSSILTNPILAGVQDGSESISGNDPMIVFEKAVANGMMTIDHAALCLVAKRNEIIQSSVLSVQEGMKESGAGRKVLRWLWASGIANDNKFLMHAKFSKILMEFIVAENLQEVAWTWIRRALVTSDAHHMHDSISLAKARREKSWPLFSLIRAEASSFNGLDSAYMALSRAAGYLKDISAVEKRHFLGASGRYLSHETGIFRADQQPPSESAYDSFLSLIPVISAQYDYHFAHLNLHHPTRPSAEIALSYLKSRNPPPNLSTRHARIEVTRNNIQLGLTTAKFLLEEHRYDDADWVINYLQSHYSAQLGGSQTIERAKAEASNLQLLEGLSFA